VAAECGDSLVASLATGTFATDCGIFAAPFTESFAAASLPICWSLYTGLADSVFAGAPLTGTTDGWEFNNVNTFGSYHAALNVYGTSCSHWIVSPAIDLSGLSMASDIDFNKKSCTTGHTGFGVPYATDPDHSDVPRSAARPLRYMDRYVTITQGEIMEMTEMLAQLEGIERGPAGQTSLAAAFSLAQDLPEDAILVVSETEYTGAGKHVQPHLWFAKENGIEVKLGDPKDEVPGKSVVLPSSPALFQYKEADINHFRQSLIKKAVKKAGVKPTDSDLEFLAEETKTDVEFVKKTLEENGLL
jgi:hypothetical protein